MNYAVVLAAGSGRRFGGNKLFETVNDLPLLYYSLKSYQNNDLIDGIVVTSGPDTSEKISDLVNAHSLNKVRRVIKGGSERQHSVHNALREISGADNVAIHDAARPLLTKALIEDGFRTLAREDVSGAIPVLPISDTVKFIKGNIVMRTVSRDGLYLVQTPQVFDFEVLRNCHNQAFEEDFVATDDAGLLENYGYKVASFTGNRNNVKVTYKEDLELVRFLLRDV